jgi:hypothetical protein
MTFSICFYLLFILWGEEQKPCTEFVYGAERLYNGEEKLKEGDV